MFFPKVSLPKLDYNYDELEPVLSRELLTIHHSKHHQNYIDTYNNLVKNLEDAKEKKEIKKIISLLPNIKFNLGSHINHSLYWKNLSPIKQGGGIIPEDSQLLKKINEQWGSLEKFKGDFISRIMKIQGSGWGNLALDKTTNSLEYIETKDQDPVALQENKVPILCIDAWEHAWYLKYLNNKKTYYTEIWKIINWQELEKRYIEAYN